MGTGGARSGAGRPRESAAVRRAKPNSDGYHILPRTCTLPIPSFPLMPATPREHAKWNLLWQTPQANYWHAQSIWLDDIALYVRLAVAAEGGDLKAASEARQWSDRLGLNHDSMTRKKWRVESDEDVRIVQVVPIGESDEQKIQRLYGKKDV